MPARSEAQRRFLNAHFGHDWVVAHHFDNAGPLPAHIQETPVNPILATILAKAGAAHGAPPPQQGPGLPPELAAAISHGAPPAQAPEDDGSSEDEQNEVQLLTKIIGDIQHFLAVAADEDDKSVLAACLAQIQKLRAKDQQEQDGALGGKTSPRLIRKAAAAQGGANGGL